MLRLQWPLIISNKWTFLMMMMINPFVVSFPLASCSLPFFFPSYVTESWCACSWIGAKEHCSASFHIWGESLGQILISPLVKLFISLWLVHVQRHQCRAFLHMCQRSKMAVHGEIYLCPQISLTGSRLLQVKSKSIATYFSCSNTRYFQTLHSSLNEAAVKRICKSCFIGMEVKHST